jgi:hypothetical protein
VSQQEQLNAFTRVLREQAAQIQKVSAELAADRAVPRIVSNER